MLKFKDVELTPEQVRKAMECDTPEELMAICKEIHIDITKQEAEKALENLAEIDLSHDQMKAIAGGGAKEVWDDFVKSTNYYFTC